MSRNDSVTSAPPPGAARIRDLNWPDYTTSGAINLPQLRCRITGAANGGTRNVFTALTNNWNFNKGSDCYSMQGGAAGGQGGSYSWVNNANINVRTSPVNHWPLDDDWNVHRVIWIASAFGTVTTSNDMGVELLSSNVGSQGILRTPQNGFGFRWAPGGVNGKVNFITRNVANGLSEITLATDGAAGFNIQNYHSYELRIFSALPNQPPFLKVLIDDILLATIPWSNGTLPANGESGAALCGFVPVLICDSSSATAMFTKYLSFQAGPNEASCF